MLNVVLALSLVARVALATPEDTLESVEKTITEKSHKLESLRAKMKTVTDSSNAGMSFLMTQEGTYELLVKDGKTAMRSDVTSVTTTKIGDQETKIESKSTFVTKDGKSIALTEQNGMKTAMKMPAATEVIATGNAFDEYKKSYDLKLAGEDKVAGRSCWQIEGTPKQQDGMTGSAKWWFDQDTGFMLKMEMMNADGKPMTTMTYTDLEFGAKIDDSKFSLEIPKGYTVMDTGAGG